MKGEKVVDLVARGQGELRLLIDRRRGEIDDLRYQHARGELRATHTLRLRRHDLARAETALGQLLRRGEGGKP